MAETLSCPPDTNRLLDLGQESIEQARETLGIFERLGDTAKQATCFIDLAWASYGDNEIGGQKKPHCVGSSSSRRTANNFGSAKVTVFLARWVPPRAIQGMLFAISRQPSDLFWIHYSIFNVFSKQNIFDPAHDHVGRAESYAADYAYRLGRAMEVRASFRFEQGMFEETRLEASRAVDADGIAGAARDADEYIKILGKIGELDLGHPGEPLQAASLPADIDIPSKDRETK